MAFAAFLFWFLEFALEVTGSLLAYRQRRKIPLLFALLYSAAWLDIVGMILIGQNQYWYAWESWADYLVRWLLLCFLGCQVCGKLMGDGKRYCSMAISVCFIAALLSPVIWSQSETLKDKLLDGAGAADAMLLVLLGLAVVGRAAMMPNAQGFRLKTWLQIVAHNAFWVFLHGMDTQWLWIMRGVFFQIGWDLLCTFLWGYWDGAKHLLPIGELSALLMCNYAVWSAQKLESRLAAAKKEEVRLPMSAQVRGIAER